MRKLVVFMLPFVALVGGCQGFGGKTHCGYGFWFHNPASIDTNMPVLINPLQTTGTAHPVGSVAGPVTQGDWTHGVVQPVIPQPMPKGTSQIGGCDPTCPYPGPPRMTIQEFRDVCDTIQAKPSPAAPSRNVQ